LPVAQQVKGYYAVVFAVLLHKEIPHGLVF